MATTRRNDEVRAGREGRGGKKSNLLCVKEDSLNSTCAGRPAKTGRKITCKQINTSHPLHSSHWIQPQRSQRRKQNVQLVFQRGLLHAVLCRFNPSTKAPREAEK